MMGGRIGIYWNLLVSIGDSSDLITGRDKINLNNGDIVLFNGGRIRHQVKIHKGNGIKGSKSFFKYGVSHISKP